MVGGMVLKFNIFLVTSRSRAPLSMARTRVPALRVINSSPPWSLRMPSDQPMKANLLRRVAV